MTQPPPELDESEKPDAPEFRFFELIARLVNHSPAARATLRRSLYGGDRYAIDQQIILRPRIPQDVPTYDRPTWQFCACLFAQFPQETVWHEGVSFGESCRWLEEKTTSNGVDRRFRQLLTLPPEDLDAPLRHLFGWVAREGVQIDYPKLLQDLCRWGHSSRYVQDRWAQDFWSTGR